MIYVSGIDELQLTRSHFITYFVYSADERKAIKAIIVAIVLSILNQFSGCFTFLTYAGSILNTTGSTVSPYMSSIIFGVVQIMGSLFTTQLADRWGRKVLLIISLFGTVLGQTALSIFMYFHKLDYDLSELDWIPAASIAFVIFIGSVGIIPLTSICTVEILPAKVRQRFFR